MERCELKRWTDTGAERREPAAWGRREAATRTDAKPVRYTSGSTASSGILTVPFTTSSGKLPSSFMSSETVTSW